MNFKINIKPLSINDCWQGRRVKTERYRNYEKELLFTLPNSNKTPPPYKVFFEFGFSNAASDLDNPVKCLLDIMQKKYLFNDKDIYELHIKKKIVQKGEEYFIFNLESIHPTKGYRASNK